MNIKEIARLAGVSVATVSRTINHQGKASPEVQKRIREIMKKTGYVPNATGRSLRTTRTGMVLVLLPTLSSSFYSRIVEAVSDAAGRQGYSIIVAASRMERETEEGYLNLMRMHQVDGIIALATMLSREEIQEFSRQYPLVIACECPADTQVSCVEIDNYKAAYDAAAGLARRGHRRIAMVNFAYHVNSSDLREKGFRQALQDAGITPDEALIIHTGMDVQDGSTACDTLLAMTQPPTAAFCYSDALAVGMVRTLETHGLKAGKEMEIIGFDDTDLAGAYLPGITSVAQPGADIGLAAFSLLQEKMEDLNSMPKKVILPHTIVYRETAGET